MTEEIITMASNNEKLYSEDVVNELLFDIKRLECERDELKRLLEKSMEQTDKVIDVARKTFETLKKCADALKEIKEIVHKEGFEKCPLESNGMNNEICYLTFIDKIEKRIDEVLDE